MFTLSRSARKPSCSTSSGAVPGWPLAVDVAVEAVFLPQQPQAADHQLRGVVGAAQHAGGEEQPLDVVPAVELDGEVGQLLRGEGARRVSLLRRLTQYLQSYAQQLVIRTFSSVTHRPSAEKEWQQPATEDEVLPMYPFREPRSPPLEVQAASYLGGVGSGSPACPERPCHRQAPGDGGAGRGARWRR